METEPNEVVSIIDARDRPGGYSVSVDLTAGTVKIVSAKDYSIHLSPQQARDAASAHHGYSIGEASVVDGTDDSTFVTDIYVGDRTFETTDTALYTEDDIHLVSLDSSYLWEACDEIETAGSG